MWNQNGDRRLIYMSWLTILPNMNAFCWRVSEKLCSQDLTMLQYVMSHNSYKFCGIKMASQQAHLHVMINNPTKYEQILPYGFRGVAFTKCHRRTDRDHYYVLRHGWTTIILKYFSNRVLCYIYSWDGGHLWFSIGT